MIYVRPMRSRECLCSEFSLAQQKRTKEGFGPVLAGRRGSAHRTDMKVSGFIRQRRRAVGELERHPWRTAGMQGAGSKDPGRIGLVWWPGGSEREWSMAGV